MCYANEKKAQVQAYLKVSGDVKHPLHEKVGIEVHPLKRGTEWMNKATGIILYLSIVMYNRPEVVQYGNRLMTTVTGHRRLLILRLTP